MRKKTEVYPTGKVPAWRIEAEIGHIEIWIGSGSGKRRGLITPVCADGGGIWRPLRDAEWRTIDDRYILLPNLMPGDLP